MTGFTIIEADYGEGMQEYVDEFGTRIPEGNPVGIENFETGEFIILSGVYFSND